MAYKICRRILKKLVILLQNNPKLNIILRLRLLHQADERLYALILVAETVDKSAETFVRRLIILYP